MSKKKQITVLYKTFCEAEGNEHISSEYAINILNEIIGKFKIRSVLEIGLGIGSISGILLEQNPELNYSGTESNSFCIRELNKNLGKKIEHLLIYKNLAKIPADLKFDLIIIDGNDSNLKYIKKHLSFHGIIAIEGDRFSQEGDIKKLFPGFKYVHSISLKKNKLFAPFASKNWQGGIKIIFIKPNFNQSIWWMKEKIFTKIKYWYPGRFLGKG